MNQKTLFLFNTLKVVHHSKMGEKGKDTFELGSWEKRPNMMP